MPFSAHIFNIQHFSLHDGPGIRTTVFMKGCNLRCRWCHNPESWTREPVLMRYKNKCIGCGECIGKCPRMENGKIGIDTGNCIHCGKCAEVCYAGALELTGRMISADDLLQELLSDIGLYETSGGGVTFSGGEPLLQHDFLLEILTQLKEHGVHTAIESALCVDYSVLSRLLPVLDLVMCDIKCMSPILHETFTSADNKSILENIRSLAESGKQLIIRTPVVPGFNDTEPEIGEIISFIKFLPNLDKITYELLPFSGICKDKYDALGMEFPCANLSPPAKELMQELARIAGASGIKTHIN